MAYSTVRGGYHFADDGDWFTFSGTLSEYDGGGALQANKWYTPEQLGLGRWNDHDSNDKIMFDYVSNQTGWGSGGLTMESYHDTNSGQTIDNIDNATSYSGFSYFEGELKADGLVYEVGPEHRTIDLAGSISQTQPPVVPSTLIELPTSGGTTINGPVTIIYGPVNAPVTIGGTTFNGVVAEGTDASEEIKGMTGESENRDSINGFGGNDVITGARGLDHLDGGNGDDIVKAGNGGDVITGGTGSDTVYGGFGKNTFTGEKDNAIDNLYLKSDHLAYNYLYDKAGNNAGNAKADEIESLDSFDKIHIQGAMDYELTVMQTMQPRGNGTLEGIGIFASGSLEAVYTGGDLTVQQVQDMTIGVAA